MAEEPQPPVNVSGAAGAAIGGDAKDVQIQTSHVDQRGGQVLDHPVFHGPTTIVQQASAGATAAACFVPPPRLAYLRFPALGPKFAGRAELLVTLDRALQPGQAAGLSQRAAVQADGGVGKTALAVELGWRLFDEGRFAYVLLLNATSPDTLSNDLAALCERDRLNLPEQQATDQQTRFQGVLAWLQAPDNARRTLLILDNADTPEARGAVRALHPRLPGCALLVTSRAPVGGGIPEHRLDLFTPGEARDFLRTHLDPRHLHPRENSPSATAAAENLDALLDRVATAVDHLPLALEIVCSYLRETRQSPQAWLQAWPVAPAEILGYHNAEDLSYPVSLSRVWEQSFARPSADARELLQFLAWLAPRPAALPLAPLKKLMKLEVWPEFRKLLIELEKASLLQWSQGETDSSDAIALHRVLQAVVREGMPEEEKAASRAAAVALFNAVIPSSEYDAEGWRLWEQLKPHLQVLLGHIKDTSQEPAALRWMNEFALWLRQRAQYAESEPLHRRGVALAEKLHGPEHPKVTIRLSNLAQLLQDTHRLAEAEPLMRRALAIDEASFGFDHPNVAIDLNNLAQLLQATHRLAEAEPLMRRSLAIDEVSFGPDHPRVGRDLNNLALLLHATDRLAEAEPLLRRALAIDEASFGPHHPAVALPLNNLAQLLQDTRRLAEAEPLMRRALAIDQASFGPHHPDVALHCNNLAQLLKATQRLAEAEPLMRRALAIDEASFSPDHPTVARDLNNLALLLQDTHRLAEAEPLMGRALAIDEASFGPDHPTTGRDLNNLAHLLQATHRLAEAEPLMRRALAILLRAQFLTSHTLPNTAMFERNYRRLLEKMKWPGAQIDAHLAAMHREATGEVDSR